jgi:predicted esterase
LYPLRFYALALCLCLIPTICCAQSLSPEQAKAVSDWLDLERTQRGSVAELGLPGGLDKAAAEQSAEALWGLYRDHVSDAELGDLPISLKDAVAKAEGGRVALPGGRLTLGEDLVMPFALVRKEAEGPGEAGRALFICTHGGGGNGKVDGPHAWPVNTREWQTQVQLAARLYAPQGIYFVPRMVDDRKGRWFHGFNQTAFERVIEHAIAHWGVDPNRVYKLGISQGGFGTNKLVTFMPDRFAGANPMAGGVNPDQHPPINLRNVAFRNDVGEKDTMFDRVGNAIKFHERLDQLHAEDPQGYIHEINVQKGRGHGIDYRPGVKWIAKHSRTPWPSRLAWDNRSLGGERRLRHYWIELVGEHDAPRTMIVAEADRETNTISLTAEQQLKQAKGGDVQAAFAPLAGVTLRVLLHDALVDLDKPVKVVVNGKALYHAPVRRDTAVQLRTLASYGDPTMTASAELVFALDE